MPERQTQSYGKSNQEVQISVARVMTTEAGIEVRITLY